MFEFLVVRRALGASLPLFAWLATLSQLAPGLAAGSSSPINATTPASASSNWCGNGTYKTMDNEDIQIGCTRQKLLHWPWEPKYIDLRFFIFDKDQKNSDTPLKTLTWNSSINDANLTFASNDRLIFISHGYTQDGNRSYINDMRKTFFNLTNATTEASLKVFQLDWPKGALGSGWLFRKNYVQAATNVANVGRLTAEFIYRICKKYNISGTSIHLVGHSLGGHVVGEAAAWLKRHRGITPDRVTALDAASVLFSWFVKGSVLLNHTDTSFLEVFHTSATTSFFSVFKGAVGLYEAIGHVDLYPNKGVIIQPTCQDNNTFFCSHNRDNVIYRDILNKWKNNCDFSAELCENEKKATSGDCNATHPVPAVWKFVEESKRNLSTPSTTTGRKTIFYFKTENDQVNATCKNTTTS